MLLVEVGVFVVNMDLSDFVVFHLGLPLRPGTFIQSLSVRTRIELSRIFEE